MPLVSLAPAQATTISLPAAVDGHLLALACSLAHAVSARSTPSPHSPTQLRRYFGRFGGRYIPETLMAAHEELERVYVACTQVRQ